MRYEKFIVWHLNSFQHPVFDVLVNKKNAKKFKTVKEDLYQIKCPVAEFCMKINPNLTYLGSEDFEHIPQINKGVEELVRKLKKKGFKEVRFDELETKIIKNILG